MSRHSLLVLLLLSLCAGTATTTLSASAPPSPEEFKELLRRYNAGERSIAPQRKQLPNGAEQFNRAVQIHSRNEATSAELKEAAKLYQEALQAGISQAGTNLALLYLEGRGVKKDVKKALKLLSEASAKNDTQADMALARLYLNGTEVKRDEKKGEALLAKAVKSGNPGAVTMQAEYREWKKKNQQAMKEYQELLKKVQMTPVTPGSPQPLQILPQTGLAPAARQLPVIPGQAYISGRQPPMPNFLATVPAQPQRQPPPLEVIPPGGLPPLVNAPAPAVSGAPPQAR